MHFLVTGGCGFIGSHLVAQLIAEGHRVTILDDLSTGTKEKAHPSSRLVIGSILNHVLLFELLNDAVDGCFHLAAIPSVERCHHEWGLTSEVNVLGTIAVFDACRKAARGPVPVVYASSAAVYGDANGIADEVQTCAQPINSYGVDKLACEFYARTAWQNYQLPTVGLRFFNVYGPGQQTSSPYSGVITRFIHAAGRGEPLTVFGTGEQTRDFVYVGDVAQSCLAMMQRCKQGAAVFNVCTGVAVSIGQIAQTIAEVIGRPATLTYKPARPGDILFSCGSRQRLDREFPALSEKHSLKTGLQLTIAAVGQ